jgi:Phage integrase family.
MAETNVEEVRQVYLSLDAYRGAMEKLYRLAYQRPERHYVITYTLGATGRRISEALELTTRDIDFEHKTITWRILKKRRHDYYVTLPMSARLEDIIRRYIVLNRRIRQALPCQQAAGLARRKEGIQGGGAVWLEAALPPPRLHPLGVGREKHHRASEEVDTALLV